MQLELFETLTPDQALLKWAEEGVLVGVQLAVAAGAMPWVGEAEAVKAAVRQGHTAIVTFLLESVFELPKGVRLLDLAIESGHLPMAHQLLAMARVEELSWPLHAAVVAGDLDLVTQIVKGMPVREDMWDPDLTRAAQDGRADILRVLMGRPCPALGNGNALKAAAQNGHAEVIEMLRASSSDQACGEAFEAAIVANQVKVFPHLLPRLSVNQRQAGLERAAQAGAEQSLEALLALNPTPLNLADALKAAIKAGQAGTMERLLGVRERSESLSSLVETAIFEKQWALGSRILMEGGPIDPDTFALQWAHTKAPDGFFQRLASQLDVALFETKVFPKLATAHLKTAEKSDLLALVDAVGLQVDPPIAHAWVDQLGAESLPRTVHRVQTAVREAALQATAPAAPTRRTRRRA